MKLLPGIGWIESIPTPEVGGFRLRSGVFHLIPTPDGRWKGYTMYTSLTSLKDYLEKTGKFRNPPHEPREMVGTTRARSGVRGLGTIHRRRGRWTGWFGCRGPLEES